ncbi:hypothetical protein BpHYR1_018586 [Brachionus plicatilis]|uniref:Uncharacterized protein n=1 Tax=Brachionus plicatilis TaxID=10195 RepID=A0A3M7Q355_BRAPC|nr:hypothetical protein BpHYR1_018586 [Brachionus plicatilis]
MNGEKAPVSIKHSITFPFISSSMPVETLVGFILFSRIPSLKRIGFYLFKIQIVLYLHLVFVLHCKILSLRFLVYMRLKDY